MTASEASSILLAVAMSVAAGLVGCFAVMRRMTLAADSISHVALPGIGLAIIFGISPILGATAMLLFGAILIWALETRTKIPTEAIIGVMFSVALAIGSMMASGEELIDALFGTTRELSGWEIAVGLAGSAAVAGFILKFKSELVVALVSPDVASTAGIDTTRLNLLFLLVFAFTVALGLRYLGVLLMGSLIIIPAVTARRLAHSLNEMLSISVGAAMFSTVTGTYIAGVLNRAAGPLIISIAGALFFMSLLRGTED
ncbi:MAG TPA: metal ABC transporter permease [Candidatus Binataceae bacterium]|nr:metal ABC transporter permease [Candidatus Binataceae bacterium]